MQFIADIGKNFIDSTDNNQTVEDCLLKAKRLVFLAKESGATIAKFQTHVLEDEFEKRDYRKVFWIEKNEKLTPIEFWNEIKLYCDYLGIEFMTTPMSKMAAEKIDELVKRWKVSSADIVDFDLLEYLKSTGKPIILSTGMSTEDEIERVVNFLGNQIEFINYCISIYPCPVYKIDLQQIPYLRCKYQLPVGLSDHSLSIEAPVLAVKMGAIAIEKHFTLDRNAFGPDHKVSLLPDEFKKMVDLCRLAEKDKGSFEEEKKLWVSFRKNNIINQ
jgi:sialic acid synthase SpsE